MEVRGYNPWAPASGVAKRPGTPVQYVRVLDNEAT